MYIRKSNAPKTEPCGTPATTDDQLEHLQFSTTPCDLLLEKLLSRLSRFPEIPIRSNLNSNPSCYTLSNVFEISKELAPIS